MCWLRHSNAVSTVYIWQHCSQLIVFKKELFRWFHLLTSIVILSLTSVQDEKGEISIWLFSFEHFRHAYEVIEIQLLKYYKREYCGLKSFLTVLSFNFSALSHHQNNFYLPLLRLIVVVCIINWFLIDFICWNHQLMVDERYFFLFLTIGTYGTYRIDIIDWRILHTIPSLM